MKIRVATVDDVPDILDIYAPYVNEGWTSVEEEVPDEDEMWERIENYTQDFPWLVAEQNEEVIGYAYANAYRSRSAYRWSAEVSVYLAAQWHGKNVAAKLYESRV